LKKIKQGSLQIDQDYKLSMMLYLLKQSLKQERPDSVIDLFIHDTEVEANFVFIIVEHLLYKGSSSDFNVLELYRKLRNNKIDRNTHSSLIRA